MRQVMHARRGRDKDRRLVKELVEHSAGARIAKVSGHPIGAGQQPKPVAATGAVVN
jgi:hypothetical protein